MLETVNNEDDAKVYSQVSYMNIWFAKVLRIIRIDGQQLKLYEVFNSTDNQISYAYQVREESGANCFVQVFDLMKSDNI